MKKMFLCVIAIYLLVMLTGCAKQQDTTHGESRYDNNDSTNKVDIYEADYIDLAKYADDPGVYKTDVISSSDDAIRIAEAIFQTVAPELAEEGYVPIFINHYTESGVWLVDFGEEAALEIDIAGGDISIVLDEKTAEVLFVRAGE